MILPEQLAADDFIFEPTAVRLFQVRDIVCLQPARRRTSYTEVTLASGKKMIVRKSLVQIIPRLPKFFFLVRRGWVINLYHVRDLAHLDRRTLTITLSDLSQVQISRNQLLELAHQRCL
jgi:DNA-binding LytR/AlgR family response regulator